MKRVCVFCGSNPGAGPAYAQAAASLAAVLAGKGLELVYGGGGVGLMGILADACLEGKGRVIGVIPRDLVDRELGHAKLTELRVVASMHERKALMERLSDGFIAMPGGFGTLDELCEILTWAQLGIHAKPIGLLDVGGYFEKFLAFVDHGVAEGFIRPEHRRVLNVSKDPSELLELMAQARPAKVRKWTKRP